MTRKNMLMLTASGLSLALAAPAWAQDTATTEAQDPNAIIVTATKREEALNDVGLTITAATEEQLTARGIDSPADLGKLVPGFTFTQSLYSTPVYTLRGIGLYDATFGASPSVAIYTDQVPRNVPTMSDGLDLDIERVEVLKGPQGTLFGQSATGGAINYVLGQPTDTLEVGARVSYERFDRVEASGFMSGPLAEGVNARLAVSTTNGGGWQRSLSRPTDTNGDARRLAARLSLDFEVTDALTIELRATGAIDKSDPLAPQYAGTLLNIYPTQAAASASGNPFAIVNAQRYAALTTASSNGFDASFLGRQATVVGRLSSPNASVRNGARALLGTAISENARDAEWTPGLLGRSDNDYYQLTARVDYDLSDTLTFTSITAAAEKNLDYAQDLDGTTARVVDVPLFGDVRSFNQEVRVAYDDGTTYAILGATYDNVRTSQNNFFYLGDYSANADLISLTLNNFESRTKSYALFGNLEYNVTDNLKLQGGIRYTSTDLAASYCYNDPAIDTAQGTATLFGAALNSVPITIRPGECFPTDGDILLGTARSTLTPVVRSFDEDNISFRLGASYDFDSGLLAYATISQGYKAGIFSAIGASRTNQYSPATQEKVIAYEAGFKAPLAGRALQFNGAAFYYDYSDKQVRGRVQDVVFGLLEKMLNVPSSYIWGLEGELVANPADGLDLSLGATWLHSRVTGSYTQTTDGFAIYNAAGYRGDFRGSELPYTPEFALTADGQYEFPLSPAMNAFVGGTVVYQGAQNATFTNAALPADDFVIESHTTLDLRAGFATDDGRWRFTVYGENVTGESYSTAVSTFLDTIVRYRGMPSSYGVSVSFSY